jgi:hypothetical protein
MKVLLALMLIIASFSALACWKVEGTVGVDGETYQIHQKFDHGKEYLFPMGAFILKMTLKPGKEKKHQVNYVLHEKKGVTLTLVTKGEDEISEDKTEEIFAKGEEGQPNTIITLKLKHI